MQKSNARTLLLRRCGHVMRYALVGLAMFGPAGLQDSTELNGVQEVDL